MVQAIFFDIDGTLQTLGQANDHIVPDSTKKALQDLREKGIKLFIASGRPITYIPEIEKNCNFQFDGYVMMNGQYCFTNQQVIRETPIPKEELKVAFAYLIEKQIACSVATLEDVYVIDEIQSNSERYYNQRKSVEEILQYEIYQIMVFIHESDKETENHFFTLLPSCKSARWLDVFMDVIGKDGGKNVGIDAMLDHFHIDSSKTMAFGDGGNDISMLQHVKIGVAMGNASKQVKESAAYTTTNILDDGIMNALKHFSIL